MSPNLKLLFVDDDVSCHLIAEKMFLRYAITKLVFAVNGTDAQCKLNACAEKHALPDCIISDWEMPGMDGLTLLTRMQGNARYKKIPFILVSGHMSQSRRELASKTGAYACFEKSISYRDLVQCIRTATSGMRAVL